VSLQLAFLLFGVTISIYRLSTPVLLSDTNKHRTKERGLLFCISGNYGAGGGGSVFIYTCYSARTVYFQHLWLR